MKSSEIKSKISLIEKEMETLSDRKSIEDRQAEINRLKKILSVKKYAWNEGDYGFDKDEICRVQGLSRYC